MYLLPEAQMQRALDIASELRAAHPTVRVYDVQVTEHVQVSVDQAHRPELAKAYPDYKFVGVIPDTAAWLEQQRIEAEAREPEMAQLRAQREAERTLEWYADFWSALRDVIRVAAHMEKAVRAERTRNLAVVHNYMNQLPRMATRVNMERITELLIRYSLDDVREEMEDPSSHFQRGTTPTWYVCEVCGAAGVALYRKAASSHVEMHCAQCVREVSRKTKDPATYHKNFVPAVPARGHADSRKDAAFYGLTSIPNLGCLWWESLPNEGVAP